MDMQLVIADNSNDKLVRRKIRMMCQAYNVKYISVPNYSLNILRNAVSHGFALNWVYSNYIIKHTNLLYFGFIDHDVFPLCKLKNLRNILDVQKVYGPIIQHGKHWFIWPGLCFFSLEYMRDRIVDFQVKKYFLNKNRCVVLDTGAANADSLYTKSLYKNMCHRLKHCYYEIRPFSKYNTLNIHSAVEIFGKNEWLHLICTSYGLVYEKQKLLNSLYVGKNYKFFLKGVIQMERLKFLAFLKKDDYLNITRKPLWQIYTKNKKLLPKDIYANN